MRKGFTLIELMIVIAIIAIIAAIAIPSLIKSRISANESAAASSLKTFHGQMAMWKKKNYTGNGRVYPPSVSGNAQFRGVANLGKFCGLHFDVNNAAERLKMIGIAEGKADCRSDNNTQSVAGMPGNYTPSTNVTTFTALPIVNFTMEPKAGYWFAMPDNWGVATTQVYDWTRSRNRFALMAFPDDYGSSGEDTFVINEEGTVYFLDRGVGVWINYPGNDPTVANWEVKSE